jgi:hypothetical protein
MVSCLSLVRAATASWGMRWLFATSRRVELFVAFFFAGSAAAYMSIEVVLCRLHVATGVRFPAYALGGRHAANGRSAWV